MDIQLQNIRVAFTDQLLFRDLSLEIQSGEKAWISAASGEGKSTLMKLIFGFLQPDKGEVLLDRTQINAENIEEFRLKMGYIAQSAPLPHGKVDDVLLEIASFKGNEHLEISSKAVVNALERFRMPASTLQKQTTELSGGERQRVCFAMLTLLKRNVWLLDEITSGLDLANSKLVLSEVEKIDATVLITAHDDVWDRINLKKINLHE